jgi:DNA repair exonuclease SbcCD ATPase subunit
VHIERLTIEAGDATFALDLHPSLTVIAGVGQAERRGLLGELVGALGSGRSGVHLELRADSGTRYGLLRPVDGPARVISLARGIDVTPSFTSPDGQVNILERAGLTARAARSTMRLTATDLTTRSQLEERVLRLAHVDQARLWDVARKVQEREAQVAEAAASVGSDVDDAVIFEEIERRHAEFEAAQTEHERVRRVSLLVGANAAVLAIPLAGLYGLAAAVPAVMLAIGMTIYSYLAWQKMEQARRDEQAALSQAGAQSYLTFQINRVNNLVSDDHQRRQMMQAAEYHRAAVAEWRLLAGDISVEWAVEHKGEVRAAATRLRDTVGAANRMGGHLSPVEETTADLAHALLHRLNQLRELGAGGESFPLLLDEPFPDVDPAVKADLLELLMRASVRQQVIFLTEDTDVASWARVEAMTGNVAIVEPVRPAEGGSTGGDGSRRSKHVAA